MVVLVVAAGGALVAWHRHDSGPAPIDLGSARLSDTKSAMTYSLPAGWVQEKVRSTAPFGFLGLTSYMDATPYACANGDQCKRALVIAGTRTSSAGSDTLGLDFFANLYGADMAASSSNGDGGTATAQGSSARRVDGRAAYTQTWRITPDDPHDVVDFGRIVVWRAAGTPRLIRWFWETWDDSPKAPSTAYMNALTNSIRLTG